MRDETAKDNRQTPEWIKQRAGFFFHEESLILLFSNTAIFISLQYYAKVMQMIIDEYRALFLRFISETSQGLVDVKTINQQDIGKSL